MSFQRYRKSSFGIIIHLGLYSVPGFDLVECAKRRKIQNGSEWYLDRLTKTFRVGHADLATREYHSTLDGRELRCLSEFSRLKQSEDDTAQV